RVTFEIGALGQTTGYSYDSFGQLSETRRYAAHAEAAGLGWDLPNPGSADQTTRTVYDELGRVRFVIDGSGALAEQRYDALGRLSKALRYSTRPTAAQSEDLASLAQFAQDHAAQASATTRVYDAFDRPVFEIAADGSVTGHVYNALGEVVKTTRYAGTLLGWTGASTTTAAALSVLDAAGARITEYVHNEAGQVRFELDNAGRLTEFEYNNLGDMTRMVQYGALVPASTGHTMSALNYYANQQLATARASGFIYNAAGEQLYAIDFEGRVTRRDLDGYGQLEHVRVLRNVLPGWNASSSATRAQLDGLDPLDARIATTYRSKAGQPLYTIDPVTSLVTAYRYDGYGQLVETRQYAQPYTATARSLTLVAEWVLTHADGVRTTSVQYDAGGRPVVQIDAAGNTVRTDYNDLDQAVRTTHYHHRATPLAAGWELPAPDASRDQARETLYDALGRVSYTVNGDGTEATQHLYDARGNETGIVRLAGHASRTASGWEMPGRSAQDQVTEVRYDAQDRAVLTVTADGGVTELAYNAFGQTVQRKVYVDKAQRSGDGWQLPSTTGAAQIVATRYDTIGRVSTVLGESGGTRQTIYNVFDEVLSEFVDGRTTVDGGAGENLIFDPTGRLIYVIGADRSVRELVYTAEGNFQKTLTYGLASYQGTDYTLQAMTVWKANNGATRRGSDLPLPNARIDQLVYESGRVRFRIHAGVVEELRYDDYGQEAVATLRYAASYTAIDYSLPALRTWATANAAGARGTAVVYTANRLQRYSVVAGGQVTRDDYDLQGNLLRTMQLAFKLPGWTAGTALTLDTVAGLSTDGARTTSMVYDAAGRMRFQLDATGAVTETRYNGAGQVTAKLQHAAVPPAQHDLATLAVWGLAQQGGARFEQIAYDTSGRAEWTFDAAGGATRTQYDDQGQEIRVTQYSTPAQLTADGWVMPQQSTAQAALNRVTETRRNSGGRVQAVIGETGSVTAYEYDGFGRVTSTTQFADAAQGAPGNWSLPATFAQDRVSVTRYNALGQPAVSIAANGGAVSYCYDAYGNLVRSTAHATPAVRATTGWDWNNAVSPADRVTVMAYDVLDRMVERLDAGGATTRNVYNAHGDLLSTVVSGAGAATRTTDYVLDAAGRVRFTIDPEGRVSESVLDMFGAVAARVDYAKPLPGARTLDSMSAFYGASANRSEHDRYSGTMRGADGAPVYDIDAAGYLTVYEVDAYKRVTGTVRYARPIAGWSLAAHPPASLPASAAGLTVADPAYDRYTAVLLDKAGRVLHAIDAEGALTEYQHNGFGEVTRTTRYGEKFPGGATRWSQGVAHGETAVRDFISLHLQLSASRSTATGYDAAGRVSYEVGESGYVTSYARNAFGDAVVVSRHAQGLTGWSAQYPLAADGTPPSLNGPVQRTVTVTDTAGRNTYEIDAERYLTQVETNAFGEIARVTRYPTRLTQFSAGLNTQPSQIAGLLATLALNASGQDERAVTTTNYNGNGQVAVVTRQIAAGVTKQTRTEYDGLGQAVTVTRAAGTADASATRSTYDKVGRLLEQTVAHGTPEAATTRYTYFADRVEVTDPRGIALAEGQGAWTDTGEWIHSERLALGYPGNLENLSPAQRTELRKRFTSVTEYDRNGRLVRTVTPARLATAQTIDAFGNVVRSASYVQRFDGNGVELAVPEADQAIATFAYDSGNRKILQLDPVNRLIRTRYDDYGNVAQIVEFANAVAGNLSTEQMLALGAGSMDHVSTMARTGNTVVTEERFGGFDASATRMQRVEVDFDGYGKQIARRVMEAAVSAAPAWTLVGTWGYEYDALGKLLVETLPVDSRGGDGVLRPVRNVRAYDSRGNLVRLEEASGLPEQRVTRYTWDLADRMATRALGDGVQAIAVYDAAANQVVQQQLPVEHFEYDLRGNLIQVRKMGQGVAGNGLVTRSFYDAADRKRAEINGVGAMTQWDYDKAGYTHVTRMAGSAVSMPANSAVELLFTSQPQLTAGAEVRQVYTRHDHAGRQIASIVKGVLLGEYRQDLAGGAGYVSYTGNVVTQNTYDAYGNLIEAKDARGYTTRAFYDKAGRKTLAIDAEGYVTAYDHQGSTIVETRYGERPMSAAGDADAARRAAYEATFNAAPPANWAPPALATAFSLRMTTTQYNARGDVLSSSVWLGADLARPAGEPAEAVTRYTYNALGQALSRRDADGVLTSYAYDALGRQTQVTQELRVIGALRESDGGPYTATASDRQVTDTVFDGLGNVKRQTQRGLSSNPYMPADADRITLRGYDALGRVDRLQQGEGSEARIEYFDYDADGNLARSWKIVHDALGAAKRQETVTAFDGLQRAVRTYSHTVGQTEPVLVNAIEYNAYGDLARRGKFLRGASAVYQESFEYDNAGRAWRSNERDGVTRLYMHDGAGNLTLTLQSDGQVDLGTKTLADLGAAMRGGAASGSALMSHLAATINVYDARQQLVDTIRPRDMNGVLAQLGNMVGGAENGASGATLQLNRANGSASQAPVAQAATVSTASVIGRGNAEIAVPYTLRDKRVVAYPGGEIITTVKTESLRFNLNLPDPVYGASYADNYEVEVKDPLGNLLGLGVIGPDGDVTVTFSEFEDMTTLPGASFPGVVTVYRRANSGEAGREAISVGTITLTDSRRVDPGHIIGHGSEISYSERTGSLQIGWTAPPTLGIAGLPATTEQVRLFYRNGAELFLPRFMHWPGVGGDNARKDAFYTEFTNIVPGNYSFEYYALDGNGTVVGTGGGSFTHDATSMNVTAQYASPVGGIGSATVVKGISTPTVLFVDQGRIGLDQAAGPLGATAQVRYRLAGSSTWQTAAVPNYSQIAGSFFWSLPNNATGV
ncbi:MAG TPA: hypothetical protein VIT92_01355, partial [Burkholderiaceae bacterium]